MPNEVKKVLFLLSVLVLFCIFSAQTVVADPSCKKKQILIIHSYHKPFLWTNEIDEGISSVFDQNGICYDLFIEFMDTKHFSGDGYIEKLAELYGVKYGNMRFDVILCSDNAAFRFLRQYKSSLFHDAPLVFCGFNDYRREALEGVSSVTGVSEWVDFDSTLSAIKVLQPEVKKIFIISEATDTGRALKNDVSPTIKKFENEFIFEYHDEYSYDDLLKAVSLLNRDTVILFLAFFQDINGTVFEYDVIRDISKASAVPVYAGLGFYLGEGITGGVLVSGKLQGEEAARLAVSILKGQQASDLPVITKSPNSLMFDYEQIQRFSLHLDRLKQPYSLINKKPGLYEQYRNIVHMALLIFAILLILINVLVFNILKRRKVEKELSQSRDILSRAHSLTKTAHWSVNIKNNMFIPSKEMCNLFGKDLNGFSVQQLIDKYVHKDDRNKVSSYINDFSETESPTSIEYRVETSKGIRCLFSTVPNVIQRGPSGEPLQIMGTLQDISERHEFEKQLQKAHDELFKRNEELHSLMEELSATNEEYEAQNEALLEIQRELIESEKKFRLIADSISDIIWIVDDDEKIRYISPPVEQLLQYTVSEVVSMPLDALFTDASVALLRNTFSQLSDASSLKTVAVQLEQKCKDGRGIWTETLISPIMSEPENRMLFICVTRDLSERFRMQEYMIQTEKMRTIAGLAAGMAHEINNPLSIVLNSSDTLLMRSEENYLEQKAKFNKEQIAVISEALHSIKFHEYIGHIVSAGKRAASIIINMLSFSKKNMSVKMKADINRLMDQTLELASKEYRVNENYDFNAITIKKDYSPVPEIYCVPTEIEQVFLNIIKNAFQAMADLTDKQNRMIRIQTGLDKDHVFIEIADRGPGIAPEYIKCIFDPFFTTKSGSGKGTGLGLSISYYIITQNHKGTIEVASDENGAVFIIRLPLGGEFE